MFKKSIVLLLIIFSILNAQSNNKQWVNPYKDNTKIHSIRYDIKKYKVLGYNAGHIKNPKEIRFHFRLYQNSQLIKTKVQFKVSLMCGDRVIDLNKTRLNWRGGQYNYAFRMPKLDDVVNCYIKLDSDKISFMDTKSLLLEKNSKNIIFLLDNSISMMKNDKENKRLKSLYSVFKNNQNRYNKVSVIGFSDDIEVIWDWKKIDDIEKLRRILNKPFKYGQTDMAKAFSKLSEYIKKKKKKHEDISLVFLTDGNPTGSYHNEHTMVSDLNIPIYSIGLGDTNNFNESLLKKISKDSGGKYFNVDEFDLGNLYKDVLRVNKFINRREFFYSSKFVENEMITFYSQNLELKDAHLFLEGERIEPFLKKKEKRNKVLFAFMPMVENQYKGYIRYRYNHHWRKESISFVVKKNKNNSFSLNGHQFFRLNSSKGTYRFPFIIKNLKKFKEMYNFELYSKNVDTNKTIYFKKQNLLLDSNEMKSLSLEVDLGNQLSMNDFYLLIHQKNRYYMYDLSFDSLKKYSYVFRNKLKIDDNDNIFLWSIVFFWLLTFLLGCYYWVNQKRKRFII